ncbi:hypothetical protein [Clostridium brassicae]|uniref:Uncharacterized protein n=1 Tax=Clostridium brassicae TaxID=2999072 RepID=A0ABT4DAM5_9CLOT|nr:hypothetical protein [Clostridium brassicae]MCY6959362.1 hypothetical protein [Clostridium brassicae]
MDKLNSELVEPKIPGAYYIAVKLNDGLDYNNYTAKIKNTSTELVYDDSVKKFFYDDYKTSPSSVTIVIIEKSSGKTQEVILNKVIL